MSASTVFSDYMICDVIANRPAAPGNASHVASYFYATDTIVLYVWNGSSWATISSGGGGSLTSATAQLSANVTMTNANQYYDGPSISCVAGTWLIVASLTIETASSAGYFTGKIWDGTTNFGSTELSGQGTFINGVLALVALVTPGSTTSYKASVACTGTANTIKAAVFNNAAGNTASTIVGVKIA